MAPHFNRLLALLPPLLARHAGVLRHARRRVVPIERGLTWQGELNARISGPAVILDDVLVRGYWLLEQRHSWRAWRAGCCFCFRTQQCTAPHQGQDHEAVHQRTGPFLFPPTAPDACASWLVPQAMPVLTALNPDQPSTPNLSAAKLLSHSRWGSARARGVKRAPPADQQARHTPFYLARPGIRPERNRVLS